MFQSKLEEITKDSWNPGNKVVEEFTICLLWKLCLTYRFLEKAGLGFLANIPGM